MTHEEGFLRAIRDEPDDDGLRLIFADWLEERGDVRGTLMRLQVTRAALPESDPRRAGLEVEEKELLERHDAVRWLGPLMWRVRQWRFRRGLLHVEADGGSLFTQPLAAGPAGWVERLNLWSLSSGQLGQLVESPHLAALTVLDLHFNRLGDGGVARLAAAPRLGPLRWLDLSGNNVGDGGAEALARSAHLKRLGALHLSNNGIGPAGAAALARSPGPALRTLDLSYNRLGDRGATMLAGAPALAGLRSLYLSGNRIGPAGALALAASPHLSGLEALHLSGNGLDAASVAALRLRFGAAARC